MRLDIFVGVGTLLLTAGQLCFGLRCHTCTACKGSSDKGKLVDDELSDSCMCEFDVRKATYPKADLEKLTYNRQNGYGPKITNDFCKVNSHFEGKFTFECYCSTDDCDACKLGPWPKKKKLTCQSCGDGGCKSVEDDGLPIQCEDSSCYTDITIDKRDNNKLVSVDRGCGAPVTSDSCYYDDQDGEETKHCYCTSDNCNKDDGETKPTTEKPKKCPGN